MMDNNKKERDEGESGLVVMVRLGRWEEEDLRRHASAIRMKVFVEEQGVPADLELDDRDAQCWHALAFTVREGHFAGEEKETEPEKKEKEKEPTPSSLAKTYVGTGRLLPDGHIGRMAVMPSARGRGVGARLLEALVEKAREVGHQEVVLSAQTHAEGFYQRLGFVREGQPYIEEGTDILHVDMRRKL